MGGRRCILLLSSPHYHTASVIILTSHSATVLGPNIARCLFSTPIVWSGMYPSKPSGRDCSRGWRGQGGREGEEGGRGGGRGGGIGKEREDSEGASIIGHTHLAPPTSQKLRRTTTFLVVTCGKKL